MATSMESRPRLGEGLYSFGEAARLLAREDRVIDAHKLHRWAASALTFGRRDLGGGAAGLSFHDLVSLELVARFRQEGVSLQRVHRLEVELRRRYPEVERPLAYDVFFTDGSSVWAGEATGGDLIEVVGTKPGHYVWTDAIASFATEVDFSESGGARRWRPAPGIELDPARQQGRPVVARTRVPVASVVSALTEGSVAEVADWFGLTPEQVDDAAAFGRR